MNIHRITVSRIVTAVAAVFCLILIVPAVQGEVVDRIVAIVNDDIISLAELEQLAAPYAERVKSADHTEKEESQLLFKVQEEVLNQLIDKKLTDQEIKRNRIKVSDDEVNKAIEQIRSNNDYTNEDLNLALQAEGMTMTEYREQMRDRILRSKLVNLQVKSKIIITEEEVREYYDKNSKTFSGENQYHLRNILLSIPPASTEAEIRGLRNRMKTIAKKAVSEKAFIKLAKKHSEGPRADDGGDLGSFVFSDLSEQLQEALEGVGKGKVTPVLESDPGLQIFYVVDIMQSNGKSFEEAAPEIRERLFVEIVNEKFKDWLLELRKKSHIEIVR